MAAQEDNVLAKPRLIDPQRYIVQVTDETGKIMPLKRPNSRSIEDEIKAKQMYESVLRELDEGEKKNSVFDLTPILLNSLPLGRYVLILTAPNGAELRSVFEVQS
jgi:hypothetical protein